MIFVTVGTQLPFERLIKSVDELAAEHSEIQFEAQVGETKYAPKHMLSMKGLTPQQYQEKFNSADLVVSHVGMGTIISGLMSGKPMILMPRLARLGEHRNDHQLATAKKFDRFELIDIVNDENELRQVLAKRLQSTKDCAPQPLTVSPDLLAELSRFTEKVKSAS